MLNVIMLNIIMLNVIMLNVIMLNVVMLNVVMLNVVMLNVVMLNVVAPKLDHKSFYRKFLSFKDSCIKPFCHCPPGPNVTKLLTPVINKCS